MITQRLCQSCKDGDIQSVTSLLTRGANLNFCYGEMNRTPLHFSAESGNIEVVELLLHHGSSIDAVDKFGFTPLSLAVIQEGYIQCDPKQSAHGTTQVKKADAFHSIIKLLVELGADVATRDHTGNSIFHISAALGTIESLFYSLEDISTMTNAKDRMTSNRTCFVPRSKCSRLLRSPGWGYLTPLHYACCSAKYGSVKFLLESQAGCDPNAIDAYGWTPLHWAARSGNKDIVAVLLKHGASLDIEDSRGLKPFQIAFIFYHTSLVRILLPDPLLVSEKTSHTTDSSNIVSIRSELSDASVLKKMSSSFHKSTLEVDCNPCFENEKTVVSKKEHVFSEKTLVNKNETETSLTKQLQNKKPFKNLFSLQSFSKAFYCLVVCICLVDMLLKLFLLPLYFFNVKFINASKVFCDVLFVKLFNSVLWPAILSLIFILPISIGYLYHYFMISQRSASECNRNQTKNLCTPNIPTNIVSIHTLNSTNSLEQQTRHKNEESGKNGFLFLHPQTRIFTLLIICVAIILSIPAVFFFNYLFSIGFLLLYILGGHGLIFKKCYLPCKTMSCCKINNFFWNNNSTQCYDKNQMADLSDIESGTIHGVESLCDPGPQKSTLAPTKWKYEGTSGGMIADMEGHLSVTYGILPPNAKEKNNMNSFLLATRATRSKNKSFKTVSTDQVMDRLCNVAGYDTTQIKNETKHSPVPQDCNFSFVSHSLSTKTKKTNKSTKSKYRLQDCNNSAVLSQKNKIPFAFPGVLLPNVKASPASVIKGAFDGKYPGTHSWFLTMIKRLQKIQKKDVTCCNIALFNTPTLLHSDFHLPGTGNYFELTHLEENIFIWFIHRLQYRLFQCMCDHWEMTLKPTSIVASCDIENLKKDIPVQLCQSACHMARLSRIQKKNYIFLKYSKEIPNLFEDTACTKIAHSSSSSCSQDDVSSQNNTYQGENDSTDPSSSCEDERFVESSFCSSCTLRKSSSELYPVSVFEKPRVQNKEKERKETIKKTLVSEKFSWLQTLVSHLLFQSSRNCSSLQEVQNVPFEYVDSCCTASVNYHSAMKHCRHEHCCNNVQNTKPLKNCSPVSKSSKFVKHSKKKKQMTRFCNKKHVYETRNSTDVQQKRCHYDISKKKTLKEESFLSSNTLEGKTYTRNRKTLQSNLEIQNDISDSSFCEQNKEKKHTSQWNSNEGTNLHQNKVSLRKGNHVHDDSMLSHVPSRFCKISIVSATLESSSVSAECESNAEERMEGESLVESCEDVFFIMPHTLLELDEESNEDGNDDIEIEEMFKNNCLKGCGIKKAWDICFALLLQADQYHSFDDSKNNDLINAPSFTQKAPTHINFKILLDSYAKDEMETLSSQSYIITKRPCHWMLSDSYIHLISLLKTSSTDIQSGALLWQREFHKLAAYLDTTSPQLTSRWPVFYCSTTQIDRDRSMLQEDQWLPGYQNPLAPLQTPACCQREIIEALLRQQDKMLLDLADNHSKEEGHDSLSCTSHMKQSVSTTRDSNKLIDLSVKTSKSWSVASHITPVDLHDTNLHEEHVACIKSKKPTWFLSMCCLQCVIKILIAVLPTHSFYNAFSKQTCSSLPRAPPSWSPFFSLVIVLINAYFSLPMLLTFLFSYSALMFFHVFC